MKVWIVTSKFGNGHLSVASAMKEELTALGYDVVIDDILEIIFPRINKAIYGVFDKVICRNSHIYNFVNSFGRNPKEQKTVNAHIKQRSDEVNPDIIITTWSACARMIGKVNVPLYTCITDVGIHNGWISENVDCYLVANQTVKNKLIEKGIAQQNIVVYGIPIKSKFYNTQKSTESTRNVLIMGGGLGIISWLDDMLNDYKSNITYSITVIAGNNPKLLKHLQANYPYVEAVGFTDKIEQYMSKADIILSKPGGVSLFESIYTQTPYIAVNPSYEHEIENAHYITEKNIGTVLYSSNNLASEVDKLLSNNEKLQQFRSNMLKVKNELIIEKSSIFAKQGERYAV